MRKNQFIYSIFNRPSITSVIALALFIVINFSATEARSAKASTRIRTPSGGQVIFSANEASRDFDRQVIELSGDVHVVYDNQSISCDRAKINLKQQEISTFGNLVIATPTTYVEGEQAVLNYGTNTGVIYNGLVKSGQILFEGRVVNKTGANTYEAESATYTACTTCPPAWLFSGTHIKAEIGGYAHIRQPVLEVANVPILWLPYLIVPLKSERQTGLLIPSFDYSANGGAAVGLHYFLAISRSQDALFTLKNYSNRGLKEIVNYRYMLSDESHGELNAATIRDRFFATDEAASGNPVGSRGFRWFTTYQHVYELPSNFTQRTHLNLVSDLGYPRDFPDEISGLGDPALENRLSLTRNAEGTHASLDASYYINQLKSNVLDSNQGTVHRLPELRFSTIERHLFDSDLLFNTNFNYVNFAREDYSYDDIDLNGKFPKVVNTTRGGSNPGSGIFDPNKDVIRSGQRLDVSPEVSLPLRLSKFVELLPSVQFRHTQYAFNVTPQAETSFEPAPFRQYVHGQVSLRTLFGRVYGNNEVPVDNNTLSEVPSLPRAPVTLYKHEIQPEVIFSGVPWLHQSDSTFFGESVQVPVFLVDQPVSDSDFYSNRGLQFDYNDRITNRNTLTFILNNRLVQKRQVGDSNEYRQFVNLRLAQSYDFDEAKRFTGSQRIPWSDVSALLDVRLERFETNTLVRYFPYHNVVNTSSRAKVMDDRGDFLQLNFAQNYLITPTVSEAYPGRTENVGFEAGLQTRYLTFSGALAYQPVHWANLDLQVKSWSTNLILKPPGNCWGLRASIRQDIGSKLLYKLNFDFQFGGSET
jgi:LPS-assembly protein